MTLSFFLQLDLSTLIYPFSLFDSRMPWFEGFYPPFAQGLHQLRVLLQLWMFRRSSFTSSFSCLASCSRSGSQMLSWQTLRDPCSTSIIICPFLSPCATHTLRRCFWTMEKAWWTGFTRQRKLGDSERSNGLTLAPSVAEIDFLQALYREGLKLAEEEQRTLNDDQMSILKNLNILIPLRTHSENNPTVPTRPIKMINGPRGVRNTISSVSSDSLAASTGLSASARPIIKDAKNSRSGSVSSTLTGAGKTEDGAEGAKPVVPERTGPLYVGAQVAYRPNKMKIAAEYEWIQCRVVAVNGEGKQRR